MGRKKLLMVLFGFESESFLLGSFQEANMDVNCFNFYEMQLDKTNLYLIEKLKMPFSTEK